MEGPKRGPGLRAPLFDRLFDLEPRRRAEAQPGRVLPRELVLASIHSEVVRLLNTRCPAGVDPVREQERTVLNYGIPDFLTLKLTSEIDRQKIAAVITDAIAAYEPRLRHPVVHIVAHPRRSNVYLVTLGALLVLDNLAEPVSFPFTVVQRGGVVLVDAGEPGDAAMEVI